MTIEENNTKVIYYPNPYEQKLILKTNAHKTLIKIKRPISRETIGNILKDNEEIVSASELCKLTSLIPFYNGNAVVRFEKVNENYMGISESGANLILYANGNAVVINRASCTYKVRTENTEYLSKENNELNITKENLDIVRKIIKTIIDESHSLKKFINKDIYEYLRILNYVDEPLLIQDNLSLYWNKDEEKTNDYKETKLLKFDIVNHDTTQKLGYISVDYRSPGFSYDGNVTYEIYPEFRNKGIASKALKMLSTLVQYHSVNDKDLYISIEPTNYASEHVAINNEADLVFDGEVPPDNPLRKKRKIENVLIYKLSIHKKSH